MTNGLATKQNAGDYATNTALANGLAKKQNNLTFTLPLSLSGNTVSVDLSTYATQAWVTSQTSLPNLKTLSAGTLGSVPVTANISPFTGVNVWSASSSVINHWLPTQVNADNFKSNPIVWDWTELRNSSGSGFLCNTEAIFHKTMLFSGKGTGVTRDSGAYRFVHYNAVSQSSGSGTYALVLNGRMLISGGNQLDVLSDERSKQSIAPMVDKKSYDMLKAVPSVGFRYRADPARQRWGFIAQHLMGVSYMEDLLSLSKVDENTERWVLNETGVIPVVYSAVRALIREHDELRAEHDALKTSVHTLTQQVEELRGRDKA